jgi:hypothetical protein
MIWEHVREITAFKDLKLDSPLVKASYGKAFLCEGIQVFRRVTEACVKNSKGERVLLED